MADNAPRQTPEAAGPPAPRAHPLVTLRDEVDRLFDTFLAAPFGSRGLFDMDPFRRMGGLVRSLGDITPEVEVRETEDRYEITAELPGMDEKDVAVTYRDGVLSIAGEKKAERKDEKADYHLSERTYGRFTRSFRLPETVDAEGIDARFAQGVLTVTMPKRAEPAKAERKIEIKPH